MAPVTLLLAGCIALAAFGERALSYTTGAAQQMHAPRQYIGAIIGARPLSGPRQDAR
jgi:multicomponent K+:H+ antiporter subunit D